MSTRSLIGLKNAETNTVKYIYCHFDGYPEYVGSILKTSYNTEEKIEEMLKLGDLSSLGYTLEPSELTKRFGFNGPLSDKFQKLPEEEQEKLKNDHYSSNYTTAYGRDRGEDGVEARTVTTQKYLSFDSTDFIYLFDKGEWYCQNWDGMPVEIPEEEE